MLYSWINQKYHSTKITAATRTVRSVIVFTITELVKELLETVITLVASKLKLRFRFQTLLHLDLFRILHHYSSDLTS